MFRLKLVETGCLFTLEAFLLAMRFLYTSVSTGTYIILGYMATLIVFLTLVLTIYRSALILQHKYVQSKGVNFEEVDIDQRKLQTERAV